MPFSIYNRQKTSISKQEVKDRFSWEPFSVKNKVILDKYGFEQNGVEIARTDGGVVPTVNIDSRAFRKYRTWILNFLLGMYQDGEYLLTHERLFGKIISLRTEDLDMLDVGQLLNDKIKIHGKINIVKRLRDKLKDYDGNESVISLIYKELNNLK